MYHHNTGTEHDDLSVSPLSETSHHRNPSPTRVPGPIVSHRTESKAVRCTSQPNAYVSHVGCVFGISLKQEGSNAQWIDDGLSWSTIARVARHSYLHDILCSSSSSAALFQPESTSRSSSAIQATAGLTSSPISMTVWEHWLCAIVLRTALDAAVPFPIGVPFRLNDCAARARRWTRALVDGLLRWVPTNAGPRLLFQACRACAVKAGDDKLTNGSAVSLRVALLGLDSVASVWRHWAALRCRWLSKTQNQNSNQNKCQNPNKEKVLSCKHAGSGTDALRRTVSVFEHECRRALRWTGGSFAHAMRLARAMAAVANIIALLDAHEPVGVVRSSADSLTPAQCDLLVELLGPLLEEDMAAGRRRAAQWVMNSLVPCPALARGATRLLFPDVLIAIAHWLVLFVLHALASRASAAMGAWDEEAVLCQMIRLRFGSSTAQATEGCEERICARNVLAALDMCAWRRWQRDGHLSRAIPPAGAALLHAFEALGISSLLLAPSTMTGTAGIERPLPTDRLFDTQSSVTGGICVSRWAVASSAAELQEMAQQMSRGSLDGETVDKSTVERFTIAEFISRYRALVDAARISPGTRRAKEFSQRAVCNYNKTYALTHGHCSDENDLTDNSSNNNDDHDNDGWRPLPPLFPMTLDCFSHCSPINQAKLICSAAGVNYGIAKTIHQRGQYGEYGEYGEYDDPFEHNATYSHYYDDDADEDEDKAESELCIAEDTGLVTVRNCTALELLEAARCDSYAQLHVFAALILQSFLRARWSARWNAQPLRRRAQRSAALIVQTALRYRLAVGVVAAAARRKMEWREQYRARAARRTSKETLSLAAETLNVPIVEVCEMTPMRARVEVHIHSETQQGGRDTKEDEEKEKEVRKAEENDRSEDHRHQDDTGGHRILSAIMTLEVKGRSLLLRAEAKERRGMITALEERRRERWLIMEYRERRHLVQWEIGERQKVRERLERRRRHRHQLLLQQQKQQQQQQGEQKLIELRGGVKKNGPLEGANTQETAYTSSVTTPSATQISAHHTAHSTPSTHTSARARTMLSSCRAIRDHSPSIVTKRNDCPATVSNNGSGRGIDDAVILIDMYDVDELARAPRCLSRARQPIKIEAPKLQQQQQHVVKCSPQLASLLQQESDDRIFVMLSERHSRGALRQRSATAALAMREMTRRRLIFLAAVLERQELLARWRSLVLPYCLVMEALRADFIAASLVLQDRPRAMLRSYSTNVMCVMKSKEQQQQRQKHQRQEVSLGKDNRPIALAGHMMETQRMFLAKPDFGRISQLTAQPRRIEQKNAKEKPKQRRKIVTWADEVERGPTA